MNYASCKTDQNGRSKLIIFFAISHATKMFSFLNCYKLDTKVFFSPHCANNSLLRVHYKHSINLDIYNKIIKINNYFHYFIFYKSEFSE